jgi:hypothetical protein
MRIGVLADRLDLAAVGRSAAAAGGSVAGVLVAMPIGAYLAALLFEHVGVPLAREIVSDGTSQGGPVLETILVGVFLVLAALVLAIYVVVALVAPIFVVLPLLATSIVLRLTGAGLITRTLWLMLGVVALLAAVFFPTLSVFDVDAGWPVWIVLVALGGFLGRLIVELWRPDLANRPASTAAVWHRWKRLGVVWLVLFLVAIVGMLILAVTRLG